ncbi:O-methyltransferase-domain-containing protein, partial [Dichotomocladium elegans]
MIPLDPEIREYAAKHTSPVFSKEILDIMDALKADTRNSGFDVFMMITMHQAQFMSELVCITGARRILEIGTLTGYSAVAMGSALPFDGKMVTLEINPEAHAIASRYIKMAKLEDKVELRLGPAAD